MGGGNGLPEENDRQCDRIKRTERWVQRKKSLSGDTPWRMMFLLAGTPHIRAIRGVCNQKVFTFWCYAKRNSKFPRKGCQCCSIPWNKSRL